MAKLNKRKWGNPSKEQLETMGMDTPLIQIGSESIFIGPPPGDKETYLELRKVISATEVPDMSGIVRMSDKKPMKMFKHLVESKGLRFQDEYFKDLRDQLKVLILKLKFKFNRPRC